MLQDLKRKRKRKKAIKKMELKINNYSLSLKEQLLKAGINVIVVDKPTTILKPKEMKIRLDYLDKNAEVII